MTSYSISYALCIKYELKLIQNFVSIIALNSSVTSVVSTTSSLSSQVTCTQRKVIYTWFWLANIFLLFAALTNSLTSNIATVSAQATQISGT